MNKVTFSLKLGDQGPAVADLCAALQVLMEHHLVTPRVKLPGPVAELPPRPPVVSAPPESLSPLGERFKGEQLQQYFGNATAELVEIFQTEHKQEYGLEFTGYVDEPTADAIKYSDD